MLNTLRNKSAGIVMKILLGLLVISFAVWGVEDMFRMGTSNTLAQVGDTDIGVEAFRERFNRELQQSGQRFGRSLTPAEARALGIDRQVLGQMMSEAALDERARRMNLAIPDSEIAASIMRDPNFAGPDGTFDPNRFDLILRTNGLNEPMYVALQRQLLIRNQIAEGVAGGLHSPDVLTEAVIRHQNERRSISYVVLPGSDGAGIADPGEEVLRAFFEERKGTFQKPEQRSLTVVTAAADELAKKENVSDEDVRTRYEQDKDSIGRPERRTVERIPFASLTEAQAAADKIRGGASFADVAAEHNVSEADRSLGTVAKSEILDQPIGEAAFALAEGEVSAPVQGQFQTVLVRVTKIEPGEVRTFDDVKDDIRAEIARERAREKLHTLHDDIEDDRASGTTLKEIAGKFGLELMTIENVDRQGLVNGTSVNVPGGEQTLEEAFQSDVGVENNPVQNDNAYVWFDVTKVDPARERTFDEARADVLTRWRAEEARKSLDAKTDEAIKQLRDGSLTLAALAEREVAQVQQADNLDRRGGTLGASAAAQIFATAKDAFASAPTGEDGRVLFQVTAIDAPTPAAGSDEAKQLNDRIAATIQNDLTTQYVQQLQTELGASVNTQLLATTLGGEIQ